MVSFGLSISGTFVLSIIRMARLLVMHRVRVRECRVLIVLQREIICLLTCILRLVVSSWAWWALLVVMMLVAVSVLCKWVEVLVGPFRGAVVTTRMLPGLDIGTSSTSVCASSIIDVGFV